LNTASRCSWVIWSRWLASHNQPTSSARGAAVEAARAAGHRRSRPGLDGSEHTGKIKLTRASQSVWHPCSTSPEGGHVSARKAVPPLRRRRVHTIRAEGASTFARPKGGSPLRPKGVHLHPSRSPAEGAAFTFTFTLAGQVARLRHGSFCKFRLQIGSPRLEPTRYLPSTELPSGRRG
jgi:hypothetical protein